MTTHFLYPKIGVSTWIFWKFSLQVKIRYLRQPLVKFLQQLNDCNENDLVWNLLDDFLASHYASLTTKSSRFVWSITLRNLNQFPKNLVFWNQHEKFYLLIKFEETLRWWVEFSNFFGLFDIEWPFHHAHLLLFGVHSSLSKPHLHWWSLFGAMAPHMAQRSRQQLSLLLLAPTLIL